MGAIVDADRFRQKAGGTSGGDGGTMDDILRRLGAVEATVGDLRTDVGAIKAVMPHLATRADISSLETKVIRWLVGTLIAATSMAFTIAKFVN